MTGPHNILVTGGTGKAGAWVITELLDHGYSVVNADRRPADRVPTVQVDLTDLGQVYGVVEGKDAIVHLAAIPWPGEHTPELVLHNNVMSTFNLLQAACVLGVNTVVMAGSESALGFPFAFRQFSPHYLPIDEAHPLLSQDAYGLSKTVIEELGRGFARRAPSMGIVSLRFSYIVRPEDYAAELHTAQADAANNSFNLWAYVDARDAARACRLALEADIRGFEACYIAAHDTLMLQPTLELVEQVYPGVEQIAPGFGDRMSPLSGRRARELLGFEPLYSWQQSASPAAKG